MKSLSQTLNESFATTDAITEATIDQYLEMISKDYQFDKKSDDYTGFLNTNPEDSGKFSDVAVALAENPKKYAAQLKKYGLSIKGAASKEELVFVMESEDCDDDEENINENMITDFLSTLTSQESQVLLGAVTATGVILASAAADKLITYVKKNGGSVATKLIEKLETLGSVSGTAIHR